MENSVKREFDLAGVQAIYSKGELIYQSKKVEAEQGIETSREDEKKAVA